MKLTVIRRRSGFLKLEARRRDIMDCCVDS